MARQVLKSPFLSLGGQDISDHVSQVMWHEEDIGVTETVTAGNDRTENTLSGKVRSALTVTFVSNGYNTSDLNGIMRALLPPPIGTATGAAAEGTAFIIRPDAAAASASNPQRSGTLILHAWDDFGSGQVGQVVTQTQTYVTDGEITRTP